LLGTTTDYNYFASRKFELVATLTILVLLMTLAMLLSLNTIAISFFEEMLAYLLQKSADVVLRKISHCTWLLLPGKQRQIQPIRLGEAISVIVGSQASLRVLYCKRDF